MRSPEDERIRGRRVRHNGERTPDEIENEIAMTRAEMSSTLDAIQRKLSPGQILDQALSYVRSGPGEFASNFAETVKQNPVPVTLLGISLGWLMMSRRNGGARYGRYYSGEVPSEYYAPEASGYLPEEGMGSKMGGAVRTVREKVGEALGRAGEAVGGAQERMSEMAQGARDTSGQVVSGVRSRTGRIAGSMRSTTGHIAGSMRSTTSHLASGARHSAQRARTGMDYMRNEQPLLLGALGIAIGAAIGATLPRTRREDELMGEARDDLMRQAQEAGEEGLHKAERIAAKAGEAAREEAGRQGIDTGESRDV